MYITSQYSGKDIKIPTKIAVFQNEYASVAKRLFRVVTLYQAPYAFATNR